MFKLKFKLPIFAIIKNEKFDDAKIENCHIFGDRFAFRSK
jgi:hypothetical protein